MEKKYFPNEGFERDLTGEQLETNIKGGTDILFLEKSIEMGKLIHEAFINKGVDVNQLLLVQLPDEKWKTNDLPYFNDEHDISVSNGKLGFI